jgi:hypothetical protein
MYRACEYVFLTPAALGRRRYRAVCAEFDLEPTPRGYGALLCLDDSGAEITKLTVDPGYLRMVVQTICHLPVLGDGSRSTRVDPQRFALTRRGWPVQQCRCGV